MTALEQSQHDRRRRVVLWSAVFLTLSLLLILTVRSHLNPRREGATGHATSSTLPSAPIISGGGGRTIGAGTAPRMGFTMTARLTGGPLRLGEARTLRVILDNPAPWPMRVMSIGVTPQRPTLTGCQASWVHVGRHLASDGPALIVAARHVGHIDLSIGLVDLPSTNQDACKGARFPLVLAGWARKAT